MNESQESKYYITFAVYYVLSPCCVQQQQQQQQGVLSFWSNYQNKFSSSSVRKKMMPMFG
ncbi:hypothetical protein DERF_005654 [Dermatophagoides farinae]|uniref:Uncharacterized protein n=1 Tax=Dermatophagoides farinae TaxID=6954 RepID=A0A922I7B3_DERFA|nr:hypothetical protein DERF_005654 [Dermatophagoides farinae]